MSRVRITRHVESIKKVAVDEAPAVELDLEDGAYVAGASLLQDYVKPGARAVDWTLTATIVTPVEVPF